MRGCVAAILAATSITVVATLAAAQPAPSGSPPEAPPPGLVPSFPPGAAPGKAGSTPAPTGQPAPAPQPGAWPGYAPPPGYGYPSPGYGAPPGYYPPPYSYYTPGANLQPPATLAYDDGQTVPHGYQLKTRPVRSLEIAGSISFSVTYLTSILVAAPVLANDPTSGKPLAPLFAPVVGPFIAVGTAHSNGVGTLWLVLDGLVQTGGATMLILGLAAEEKYLQRSAARLDPLDRIAHPDVLVGPGAASVRWTF